eukprot:4735285-Prymnesium_polylepis.1
MIDCVVCLPLVLCTHARRHQVTSLNDEKQALLERMADGRELRIEHLKRMAMRRMKNQGLMRGWSAWSELWDQASMQRRLLAGAASRLTKPKL